MGIKSIQVPQPEFSNWIIKRRQELHLSPTCLRQRVENKISERTLKYLEDGRKESFNEYTLICLAEGLEMSYPELLDKIKTLKAPAKKDHSIRKTFLTKKYVLLSAFVFIVFLSFVLTLGKEILFNNTLATVKIHNDYAEMIVAFNKKGEELWCKNIGTKVQKVLIADLDNNGQREIIAATYKLDHNDKGDQPGWFFVFNETGELLTKHNMWKPSIYTTEEQWINIVDFKVVDLENDGRLEIVVITHGYQYHPSRLAVLHYEDKKFIEEKTYWNPGYLLQLYIEDVNNDSLPEIICVGVNNHFKHFPKYQITHNVYSVFMLNSNSIYGQAPPYMGDNQIGKGSELWYRYLTPPPIEYDKGQIEEVTFKGDTDKLIYVKIKDTCFFYLNYEGEIVDTFQGECCEGVTELLMVEKD
ncbi:VCBS repeat-containing protein [candidate division KSB1 bacterium]|nr:VCBS repeat-containing protein [candidate division KSB1 bacterium]